MWSFTQIADGWDRLREEDGRFLDEQWTSWATYAQRHSDDPGFYSSIRNAAVYTGLGASYAGWTLSTSVATGFIDILRLGDGVQKGGWGYAQDAIRLLAVAGPGLRAARLGLMRLAAIDAFPTTGQCAWVAAAKALRMTGTKHFAVVADLAQALGIDAGALSAEYLGPISKVIQQLGGATKALPVTPGSAASVLERAVATNPDSVILFAVNWVQQGTAVGHAMVAFRFAGRTVIADRTGRIVSSLSALEKLSGPGYAGLGSAVVNDLLAVKNATSATIISLLGKGSVVANSVIASPPSKNFSTLVGALGLEVRSVPMRSERSIGGTRTGSPVSAGNVRTKSITTCTDDELNAGMLNGESRTIPRRWCGTVTIDYKVYVVQPGDYLSRIAKVAYGDESRWRIVYKANRAKLGPNPYDLSALRVGMELEIPIKTSRLLWNEPLPAPR